MIVRRFDRVLEFYDERDSEKLLMRVEVPEGLTIADVEKFREHMLKLVAQQECGPS